MSLARSSGITASWIVLLTVTLVSVGTAEYGSDRLVAAGVVMAIAAIKAGLILWRFMDVASAPAGIRLYLAVWVAVCAVMIVTLFAVAG